MHNAAPQMRERPDNAVSTSPCSPVRTMVVRSTRSRTCGEASVSTSSAAPPKANTAASRFQPSRRQPDSASTTA